jgi:hypothetical protein
VQTSLPLSDIPETFGFLPSTYGYGLTIDKRGLNTSVKRSVNCDGRVPMAKLFAIANYVDFCPEYQFLMV